MLLDRVGSAWPTPQLAATNAVELHLTTMDDQGRIALRGPASTMSWKPGDSIQFFIRSTVVWFHDQRTSGGSPGLDVSLDGRCRIQIPYGVRATIGLEPGVRLMVLVAPQEHVVAALPVSRVIAAFAGDR